MPGHLPGCASHSVEPQRDRHDISGEAAARAPLALYPVRRHPGKSKVSLSFEMNVSNTIRDESIVTSIGCCPTSTEETQYRVLESA